MPTPEVRARIDEIRAAGGVATDTAAVVVGMRLPEVLEGVAPALPGSRTAAAVEALRTAWRTRLREHGDDIRRYGEGLTAAAEMYAREDERVASDLADTWWLDEPSPSEGVFATGHL